MTGEDGDLEIGGDAELVREIIDSIRLGVLAKL